MWEAAELGFGVHCFGSGEVKLSRMWGFQRSVALEYDVSHEGFKPHWLSSRFTRTKAYRHLVQRDALLKCIVHLGELPNFSVPPTARSLHI